MSTMPLNGVTSSSSTASSSSLATPSVNTADFMKLLIAQLKNQDPLQPTDNTQFVTQLAQFSSLQTLQQIQTSLDSSMGAQLLGEAMNLLGRTVTAQPTGSTPVTGVVSGIQLQGANVLLQVGSQTVNLSDVQKVTTSTSQGG